MKRLSVPAEECRYYDFSMAAAFFKEIGCVNTPQLGVLQYTSGSESIITIGWCSEEDDKYQDIPIFKSFEDKEEYDTVQFMPMGEREVFTVDGRLYITVSVDGGLGIRRINLLYDESIVRALNLIRGMPDMNYELCRIYTIGTKRSLIGYYWVGKWEPKEFSENPIMTIAPVFGGEDNIFSHYDISDLDIVALPKGESFLKNGTLWQVSEDKEYGTSIFVIMEVYGNFTDNQLLN